MERKRNRPALFLLKAVVSVFFLWMVMQRADVTKILGLFREMKWQYFFLSSLLYIFSIGVSTIRWKGLAGLRGEPPTFRRLYCIYMMGAFFNQLLPGMIGGDTVRVYYLYREGKEISTCLGSVFLDRYTGYAGLMVLGFSGYSFSYSTVKGTPLSWLVPVIFLAFLAGTLFVFGLRFGRRYGVLSGFYDYFLDFIRQKGLILKSLVLSVLIQTTGVMAVYSISAGLDLEVPLLSLFVYLPLVITATTVPISISGLGVREAAFSLLLGLAGVDTASATALSLAWFLSYVVGALPGALIYLFWRSK